MRRVRKVLVRIGSSQVSDGGAFTTSPDNLKMIDRPLDFGGIPQESSDSNQCALGFKGDSACVFCRRS